MGPAESAARMSKTATQSASRAMHVYVHQSSERASMTKSSAANTKDALMDLSDAGSVGTSTENLGR